MTGLRLVHDYKDIPEYRHSFNQLAHLVFGIDFEKFFQMGFWTDRYVCYSYLDGDKVVANVSINKIDVILEGNKRKAIQIGTVMTHPDYRKRGLAAGLMNIVLAEYESKYDFIYLFANKKAASFYPEFGFKQLQESRFSIDLTANKPDINNLRKLDITNDNDLGIIIRLTSGRKPVSRVFGVENAQYIVLFYCLNIFFNDIYYFEAEDTIVIYQLHGDQLKV
jgi:GNAT superfamily N-acetyltransferase